MKVRVTQSCPTLCDPIDYYRPWNSPGQNTGVRSLFLLQEIFLTQGLNPALKMDSLPAEAQEKPLFSADYVLNAKHILSHRTLKILSTLQKKKIKDSTNNLIKKFA